MKLKKGIPVIDQGDKLGFWGGKFGGNFVPETLKKPIEDLEIQFNKLKNDKNFIRERDKYFKNWIGTPTRFIKLNNLTKHVGGAQIWSKVVSDANGGAHKIYNATVHCLLAKRSGKKVIIGDTGAGYAGKMLSMAAKKFGLKCKIFMGAKDIKRQQPNVKAMKKNGADVIPVYSGSQTLVDAVFGWSDHLIDCICSTPHRFNQYWLHPPCFVCCDTCLAGGILHSSICVVEFFIITISSVNDSSARRSNAHCRYAVNFPSHHHQFLHHTRSCVVVFRRSSLRNGHREHHSHCIGTCRRRTVQSIGSVFSSGADRFKKARISSWFHRRSWLCSP